jgi:hypothetical protein
MDKTQTQSLKLKLKPVQTPSKDLLICTTHSGSHYYLRGVYQNGRLADAYWVKRNSDGLDIQLGRDVACVSLRQYEQLLKSDSPDTEKLKEAKSFGFHGNLGILLYLHENSLTASSSLTAEPSQSIETRQELEFLIDFLCLR